LDAKPLFFRFDSVDLVTRGQQSLDLDLFLPNVQLCHADIVHEALRFNQHLPPLHRRGVVLGDDELPKLIPRAAWYDVLVGVGL
jgi:hypothetical protein